MSPKATDSLRGLRVLVAEDDMLICEFISSILAELECTVMGPVRTLGEALRVIGTSDIDAAVLDVRLGELNIYPAANELKLRGIPFILATGYQDLSSSPQLIRDAPRLTKPFDVQQLVSMLKSSLPPRESGVPIF